MPIKPNGGLLLYLRDSWSFELPLTPPVVVFSWQTDTLISIEEKSELQMASEIHFFMKHANNIDNASIFRSIENHMVTYTKLPVPFTNVVT